MGMFKVIGITGKARSGKDTVAQDIFDLCTRTGKAWVEVRPIALPIKLMMETLLEPFSSSYDDLDDMLYGKSKEYTLAPFGKSPRQMMQTLGTDWGRDMVSKSIWLDLANKEIRCLRKRSLEATIPYLYVIPDVRFANELEICDTIINVTRPSDTELAGATATHASETSNFGAAYDYQLRNTGSLDYLSARVRYILPALLAEETTDVANTG